MMLRAILVPILALTFAAAADQHEFDTRIEKGKTFYNHGKHDDAITEFREAVKLRPGDSMAHLWLGRALGRKAEKSSRFRAAFLVGDIRREFERAVELNPKNLEARSDLLDFYLEAPSMFGGGVDKARLQAQAMQQLSAAEGHSAYARIAVKEKKYDEAERHYRAALAADPKHPGYRKDLENFLRKYRGEQSAKS